MSHYGIGSHGSESCEHIRDCVHEFCRVSKTLSVDDNATLGRLAEVVKARLEQKSRECLRCLQGQAVMFSYSCDATSFLCSSFASSSSSGVKIMRQGRVLHEFLMERGFITGFSSTGKQHAAILYRDPLPLSDGKKCANQFEAGCKFYPMLRKAGHEGVSIFHLVADRAVLSSLDKLFRQRHAAYYNSSFGPDLGDAKYLLEHTDMFVSSGCSCHDIQNGLKWALEPYLQKDGLHDLHIVIESLRNSFSLLHARLPVFLNMYVAFDTFTYNLEEVMSFWRVLGVDADMIEIVATVNPRWHSGFLWVSSSLQDDPTGMEQISAVCLYMFKWRKFTESRFGTIGPSCRALLCSLLVGLEQLVAMTRSDEKATDFHLHGFVRLSCSIRRYLVIASIVAFVPDGLLVEALTDDRLVRRCDELEGILAEEVAWVQTISDSTWRRLALVAGLPEAHARLLRHDVVHSCHVASSYIHNKIFAVLRSYPWSLCVGNIATNLESLARDESNISDDFTYKVRALMHIGFSNVKLEQAILVLREASFSTISVEQGHGSCAVIHRFHPLYTGNQLASRAMLHQVRHLFTRTDAELKMEKRSCHIDALNRRQPGKTSARHAFLSFIMESAKSSLPAGAKMSSEARQEIMKQHAKLFEDLSVEEKAGFAHDAAMQAKRAKRGLQDEIDHHHDSMKLHIAHLLQETSTTGLTCRSSSLRFNDDDFKHMHSMLESQRFGWAEVQRMRARALAPPRHPPLAVLEALRSCESHVVVAPKQEKPQWVKSLCSSRDILSGSILLASLEEGSQAYLFLYATQSPYAATFLSMKLRVEALPCLDDLSGDSLMTAVGAWNQHVFEYTDMAFVGDDKVGLEEADILVFFDASFASAGQMVANGLPLRFLEIVPLKLQPTEKTSKARAPSTSALPAVVVDHPWVQEYMSKAAPGGRRPGSSGASTSHAAEGDDEGTLEEEVVPIDKEAVWAALEAKRKQWADDGVSHGEELSTCVRGGGLLSSWGHLVADCVVGQAKGPAMVWCSTYKVNKMASFSFAKYSELIATSLALEWCRRQQHWYDLWRMQDDAKYHFTPDDLASYQEGTQLSDLLKDIPSGHPARGRAHAIQSLFPTNPA